MSRRLPLLLCLVAGLSLSACATAVRGPNVDFVVATEPSGAIVSTDLLTRESRRERQRLEDEALGRGRVQGRNMNAPTCRPARRPSIGSPRLNRNSSAAGPHPASSRCHVAPNSR